LSPFKLFLMVYLRLDLDLWELPFLSGVLRTGDGELDGDLESRRSLRLILIAFCVLNEKKIIKT